MKSDTHYSDYCMALTSTPVTSLPLPSYTLSTSGTTATLNSYRDSIYYGYVEAHRIIREWSHSKGKVFFIEDSVINKLLASEEGVGIIKAYNARVSWQKKHKLKGREINRPAYSEYNGYSYTSNNTTNSERYGFFYEEEELDIKEAHTVDGFSTHIINRILGDYACHTMLVDLLGIDFCGVMPVHNSSVYTSNMYLHTYPGTSIFPDGFIEELTGGTTHCTEYCEDSFLDKHPYSPEWREGIRIADLSIDYEEEIEKYMRNYLTAKSKQEKSEKYLSHGYSGGVGVEGSDITATANMAGSLYDEWDVIGATPISPVGSGVLSALMSVSSTGSNNNSSLNQYLNQYYNNLTTNLTTNHTVNVKDGFCLCNVEVVDEDKFLMVKLRYDL